MDIIDFQEYDIAVYNADKVKIATLERKFYLPAYERVDLNFIIYNSRKLRGGAHIKLEPTSEILSSVELVLEDKLPEVTEIYTTELHVTENLNDYLNKNSQNHPKLRCITPKQNGCLDYYYLIDNKRTLTVKDGIKYYIKLLDDILTCCLIFD